MGDVVKHPLLAEGESLVGNIICVGLLCHGSIVGLPKLIRAGKSWSDWSWTLGGGDGVDPKNGDFLGPVTLFQYRKEGEMSKFSLSNSIMASFDGQY